MYQKLSGTGLLAVSRVLLDFVYFWLAITERSIKAIVPLRNTVEIN